MLKVVEKFCVGFQNFRVPLLLRIVLPPSSERIDHEFGDLFETYTPTNSRLSLDIEEDADVAFEQYSAGLLEVVLDESHN